MFSNFFIDRPIFATVLSIVFVILGGVAFFLLPVAQYPEVAPPVVQVSAIYPGANAKTVGDTVATPIELEVNGVERMLYMTSKSTNDGQMYLDVTFEVGTNLDMAQVLVQNRVSIAEAKLPEEVKRQGVTTKKKSPSILLCVNLTSPDGSYDQLYLSNYALKSIKDELARLKGVGDVAFLGPRDYSMRIWLDPNKLASLGMTVSDVVKAVKEQNTQVAAGRIGQSPVPQGANVPFQLTINTQGRLEDAKQFGNVIVKTGSSGQNVYLRDVVRDTEYATRLPLDHKKLSERGVSADDAAKTLRQQVEQATAVHVEEAAGDEESKKLVQVAVITKKQLEPKELEQLGGIEIKSGKKDEKVYLRDLYTTKDSVPKCLESTNGVELGAKNYDVNSYLDGKAAVTLAVFQLPGSNAIKTADAVKATMEELKKKFPSGIDYGIYYDTTVFVDESIHEVFKTLIEAFILVFIVVLVFLQDWRATIVPMIAVPVSLVGTLAMMSMFGFSLNNLSLFGLVLAIGIVVDDAIVVVENVERYLSMGHNSRDAARMAMAEVSGPVVAIALVLCAVFVPTAFMAGISGQFFRQFALTIAASTVISMFNSLTLSPALCAILFKGHGAEGHGAEGHGHAKKEALPRLGVVAILALIGYFMLAPYVAAMFGVHLPGEHGEHAAEAVSSSTAIWAVKLGSLAVAAAAGWFLAGIVNSALGAFFGAFNWAFDRVINFYGHGVAIFLRISLIALLVYAGFMGLTYLGFQAVPVGFIPNQDKGYLVINAQLPDGASLDRTDKIIEQMSAIARDKEKVPGVWHTIDLPGYSAVLGTNISNVGGMFVILEPFEDRKGDPEHKSADAIAHKLREQYASIRGARISVFGAPAIDGLGTTGGFKLQIQDTGGAGLRALQGSVQNLAAEGNANPKLVGLFSSFTVNQPQLFVQIDRDKLKAQKVSLDDVNQTLQAYLGGMYVNDVTLFNRNWQVNVQADARFRLRKEDIGRLEVRNIDGKRVPLETLITVADDSGPAIVNHYNSNPSAEINGNMAPGVSSGQAIQIMDKLTSDPKEKVLPDTMKADWTEITLQQIIASKDILTKMAFPLAVIFVFLVLAAQYESWSLPLSIILIVPMCLLASIAGIWLMKMDNNIFTQIGLVVLIGLAAKNAILIVEFAKQKQDQGANRFDATVEACRLRLRPILMTSFAFILGVVPLVLAKGAGAEMRVALGVAVFSGMLGVTIFGLFFTPVFYSLVMWFADKGKPAQAPAEGTAESHS